MSRYRHLDESEPFREDRPAPSGLQSRDVSGVPPLSELIENPERRHVVTRAVPAVAIAAIASGGMLAGSVAATTQSRAPLLGFRGVPISSDDRVTVPDGYTAEVLLPWGDPLGIMRSDLRMPLFDPDGSSTAADQELQAGMHHDGMHYFPIDLPAAPMLGASTGLSSRHGLLAINHEYFDDSLLSPPQLKRSPAERVAKSQAAVGVSIAEVQWLQGRWEVLRPSRFARRIHANTPFRFSGPAAGHPSLRAPGFPDGRTGRGTTGNCARGWTPWGTYLSCEEGCYAFFKPRAAPSQDERRMGYDRRGHFGWSAADSRFGPDRDPNLANHFDWVVEIDPFDPASTPVKRTALGRFHHECATPAVCRDGRIAFYLTDDDKHEYLYKFVTARAWNPANRSANRDLLDEGTLYVARFEADGGGRWLELAPGRNGLDPAKGFATQADVCLRTRSAADAAGGTRLDRPEWVAVSPDGAVTMSLTNNTSRKHDGRNPGEEAANPRAPNVHGHLLRWREHADDHAATRFTWEVFLLAGDPADADPGSRGSQKGDALSSPDGLMIDGRGVIWVQTDMGSGDSRSFGNNAMLAVDPVTREARRFLTGPRGCEITGATLTPDGRTLFVNIMHPGEGAKSNWPDGASGSLPRSATVVVRRRDGGIIGT